jgi:hypothetical protein
MSDEAHQKHETGGSRKEGAICNSIEEKIPLDLLGYQIPLTEGAQPWQRTSTKATGSDE